MMEQHRQPSVRALELTDGTSDICWLVTAVCPQCSLKMWMDRTVESAYDKELYRFRCTYCNTVVHITVETEEI